MPRYCITVYKSVVILHSSNCLSRSINVNVNHVCNFTIYYPKAFSGKIVPTVGANESLHLMATDKHTLQIAASSIFSCLFARASLMLKSLLYLCLDKSHALI